jgi:hypothetical protein
VLAGMAPGNEHLPVGERPVRVVGASLASVAEQVREGVIRHVVLVVVSMNEAAVLSTHKVAFTIAVVTERIVLPVADVHPCNVGELEVE